MLQAAREVHTLSEGLRWEDFQRSRLHQLALVRLLEVIGEAARAISDETKTASPQIPWAPIILMRNHLVHRYFHIDLPQVEVKPMFGSGSEAFSRSTFFSAMRSTPSSDRRSR